MPARVLRRSSIAFRISASFLAPMPLSDAQTSLLAPRRQVRRASRCSASSRAARPSSARRPADEAGRGSSAGTLRAAPGDTEQAPVSASSRILAARSLPMPGIVAQLLRVDAGDGVRPGRRCVGRRAVRANLERVLALDLEQVGDLRQHLRDGPVIHAPARGARTCSRAAARRRRPAPRQSSARLAGGP